MNDAALARLYEAHGARLFRLALAILGRVEDAEDVLHAVFARLARSEAAPPREPAPYLDAAARNEAMSLLRRRRTERLGRPRVAGRLVAREGAAPGEGAALEAEAIEQALDRLPDEQAEVVILKVFEERTLEEIAALTGVSRDTVASRWRYGLEKLRRLLAREEVSR